MAGMDTTTSRSTDPFAWLCRLCGYLNRYGICTACGARPRLEPTP